MPPIRRIYAPSRILAIVLGGLLLIGGGVLSMILLNKAPFLVARIREALGDSGSS